MTGGVQLIDLNKVSYEWDKGLNRIHISEVGMGFATKYHVKGRETLLFLFHHSTGSEWDPKTSFVYKAVTGNGDDIELWVHNDPEITKERASAYKDAKMRN